MKKTKKMSCSEETVWSEVHGVSSDEGRDSMVGKICGTVRFQAYVT